MKTEKELFDALQAMIEGRHTLRVPPNEDKDEDLVLSAAITELITLRRDNEDLKARCEELAGCIDSALDEGEECCEDESRGYFNQNETVQEIRQIQDLPTLGASERLRDKHYRECEEIAMGEQVNFEETQAEDDRAYNQACMDIALSIARAREGK